ncbi:MAG: hypothetical protein K9L86_06655 [Candidatus Omnitrophica bacterium]|nr:hypothetical protein [Candidatus Omnitrophota bacterium]
MSKNKRIVVTGLGPLSAIGMGKEALWKSVLAEKTGLTLEKYSINGQELGDYYAHRIKDFDINDFNIDKNILEDIKAWKEQANPIDLFYLLAVVKLALSDSKINYTNRAETERLGLIVTHENPGLDQFYEEVINESYDFLVKGNNSVISRKDYFQEFYRKFAKRGYELQTFMPLFHLAKVFNIHNYSIFLCNACASGLFAVEAAADIIKSGKCNTVVVAGSDCTSIFKYLWFKGLDMYAEDGKIKPFAKNRNGFVTGDGGAGIVLEDLYSALERGAHIYAEYLGGGFHLEGWKVAMPEINGDSYKKAIMQSLQRSDVPKEAIDLLVPHGVGTTAADYYEAKAITSIFGKNCKKPLMAALKPYIGHNLGSTALLELAISILALENNYLPKTLNLTEVDPKLGVNLVTTSKAYDMRTLMKTACGFAGYNGSVILKKYTK